MIEMEKAETVRNKMGIDDRTGGFIGFMLVAFLMFLGSLVLLWLGIDKIIRYDADLYVNAYVGNDQGNLTLNGLYSIGYFILFATAFIGGLISTGLAMLHQKVYG